MKKQSNQIKTCLGMTLLELVLAMTMTSIVVMGSGQMLTNMAIVESRQSTQSKVQGDLNMAFRRFENDITSYSNGFKPYFRIYFKPPGTDKDTSATPIANIKDFPTGFASKNNAITQFDIGNKKEDGKIEILYTYYIVYQNITVNGKTVPEYWLVRQEGTNYELLVGGFAPHAVLRDFDGLAKIDTSDIKRRDDCLKDMTTCVPLSKSGKGAGYICPKVSDPTSEEGGGRHLFTKDLTLEAGTKFDSCHDRNVLPFIEFSSNQKLVYLSLKTYRQNSKTGFLEAKTLNNTKTVFIHRGAD